jgi:hypothetical protein
MPGVHGGSNTDKDYAPHMWVGDHFVGDTKKVKVGEWFYKVGATRDKKVVAERWPANDEYCMRSEAMLVPDGEIPKEVREAISEDAFAERQAEIASVAAMFNRPRNSETNPKA